MDPLVIDALAQMAGSSPIFAGMLAFMLWTRWEQKKEPRSPCPLISADIGPAAIGAAIERVDRTLNGIEASLSGIQKTLAEMKALHKDA